jgi:hypothetical protein
MPNQTARQQARRVALDAQTRMRQARAERERRRSVLAVTVVTALAERDALVTACEARAGEALRTLTAHRGSDTAGSGGVVRWGGPAECARGDAAAPGRGDRLTRQGSRQALRPTPARTPSVRRRQRRRPARMRGGWRWTCGRTVARLDEVGLSALASACASAETVARWRAKIVRVEGSSCAWWTGAVSGRGHGRFWLSPRAGRGRPPVRVRGGHGVEEAARVPVLGSPLRQPAVSARGARARGGLVVRGEPARVGDPAGACWVSAG